MIIQENTTPEESSSAQVQQLIRLLQTGEPTNIELAFTLAKGLDHPLAFEQYLQDLLLLYHAAFKSRHKKALKANDLVELSQVTELDVVN